MNAQAIEHFILRKQASSVKREVCISKVSLLSLSNAREINYIPKRVIFIGLLEGRKG